MPDQETRKINVPKIAITVLIAVGLAVCVAVASHKEPTHCDAGTAARSAWLTTAPSDGGSPKNEGYRIIGECDTKLLHREFSCEESSVHRTNADNPYMKEALALGFTTYVCETPDGSRVEYPIQRILAP
jgi:hypothetical protein